MLQRLYKEELQDKMVAYRTQVEKSKNISLNKRKGKGRGGEKDALEDKVLRKQGDAIGQGPGHGCRAIRPTYDRHDTLTWSEKGHQNYFPCSSVIGTCWLLWPLTRY
jgi:hypothetical protein